MSTVLFSGQSKAPGDDLRRALSGAGFTVADHLLGATPPVDFGPVVAAIVETGDRADVALAQTRRWRQPCGFQRAREYVRSCQYRRNVLLSQSISSNSWR